MPPHEMGARLSTKILAATGVLMLAAAFTLLFWPEDEGTTAGEPVATLSSAWGDVRARSSRSLEWKPATPKLELRPRDAVRTLAQSRAVVSYAAGLVLNVDPESLVVIAAPPSPGGVQEVQVAEGTVWGELTAGAGGAQTVRIVGPGGLEARLVRKDAGEALRYRIRVGAGGKAEVAVLAGSARIESGGGAAEVSAGQALDVSAGATSAAVELPAFPESLEPAADAQIRIPSGRPEVWLRWTRPERAARFRVQVGLSFSFDPPLVDSVADAESYSFAPPGLETYFWRVASLSEDGREGEMGFVRRFSVVELPPPGSEVVEVKEEKDLFLRARGGQILRESGRGAAPVRGELKVAAGDRLSSERGGALATPGGALLELGEGTRLAVEKTGVRPEGGKLLALRLLEGEATVALRKGADLAEAVLFAAQGLATAAAADGARLRAEIVPGGARFVSEAGGAFVRSKAARLLLPAGSAAEVGAGGALAGPIALPRAPQVAGPEDGAEFFALDSPPRVELRWAPADGAARYRVLLGRGDLYDLVAGEQTQRLSVAHNALKPGAYVWSVAALDAAGRRGPASAPRTFRVEKDTTPPEVTADAPSRVNGAEVTVSGRTEPGARVKINGRAVDLSKSGAFTARVPVAPGSNQLVVEALDRAGNVTYKVLRVRRE